MFNQKSKEAIENHSAYLGPSPLSNLVCGGAAGITQEIFDLFGEAALVDNDIWKPLEDLFSRSTLPDIRNSCKEIARDGCARGCGMGGWEANNLS